jgi:hypothetical protein
MALSVPVSVAPGSTQQPGKQLPLLVALLSIYSVVAEASIGGLSITGMCPGQRLLAYHVSEQPGTCRQRQVGKLWSRTCSAVLGTQAEPFTSEVLKQCCNIAIILFY